jgi:hypothetical protein
MNIFANISLRALSGSNACGLRIGENSTDE